MKIRTQLNSAITYRLHNVLKVVYCKFLGDHIKDLVTGRNIGFVLVSHKLVDLTLGDLFFRILAYNISAGLKNLDVMTGNSNIYLIDLQIRTRSKTILQRCFDCLDGFINIQDLAMLDAIAVCP